MLLICDIFENFRNVSQCDYNLVGWLVVLGLTAF